MIHSAAGSVLALGCLIAAGVPAVWLLWRAYRSHGIPLWLAFLANALVAVSIQLCNDLTEGYFSHRGNAQGVANAHWVVSFEQAHRLWVEPGLQLFFLQPHHLLFFTLSWGWVSTAMVKFYVYGHVFITLFFAIWLWLYRRRWFPLVRNTFFFTNGVALVIYVYFPVAPPRLTPGLSWSGRSFAFHDVLHGFIRNEAVNPRFNEFSAVPSMHMGWAVIVSVSVLMLARPTWAKIVAVLYPPVVLVVVVVTGNHWIFDSIAAVGVVAAGGILALLVEAPRRNFRGWVGMQRKRLLSEPPLPALTHRGAAFWRIRVSGVRVSDQSR